MHLCVMSNFGKGVNPPSPRLWHRRQSCLPRSPSHFFRSFDVPTQFFNRREIIINLFIDDFIHSFPSVYDLCVTSVEMWPDAIYYCKHYCMNGNNIIIACSWWLSLVVCVPVIIISSEWFINPIRLRINQHRSI